MYDEIMRCLLCSQVFTTGRQVADEAQMLEELHGSVETPSFAPRIHECEHGNQGSFGIAVFVGYRKCDG